MTLKFLLLRYPTHALIQNSAVLIELICAYLYMYLYVIDCIFFLFSRTLRYICSCLQKSVMAKWPNDPLVKTRVVRYKNIF